MNFSNSDFISHGVILSDVLLNIDDTDYKKFNPGTYKFFIQAALESLSFQTEAFVSEKDYPVPTTLSLDIPSGCFNLQEIWVYNGDCCNKGTGQKLWWKRNYRTKGVTEGYISNVMDDTHDPFLQNYNTSENFNFGASTNNIYWYGIENGRIYFSPSCSSYSRTNIIFNMNIAVYGDVPVVPVQLREVVVDMVTYNALSKLKARDPKFYRPLAMDAYQKLYDPINGSDGRARNWMKTMDSNSRYAMLEYMARTNS